MSATELDVFQVICKFVAESVGDEAALAMIRDASTTTETLGIFKHCNDNVAICTSALGDVSVPHSLMATATKDSSWQLRVLPSFGKQRWHAVGAQPAEGWRSVPRGRRRRAM